MKKIKLITFCAFAVFLFNSCASTKQNSEYSNESYDAEYDDVSEDTIGTLRKPEATDDFLADLNPIQIENVIMLVKSGKSVKPKEITKTYLIPTNNTVELHFRDTINAVCVIFNKKESKFINFSKFRIIPYPSVEKGSFFKVMFYEKYLTSSYKFEGEKTLFVRLDGDKMRILVEQ